MHATEKGKGENAKNGVMVFADWRKTSLFFSNRQTPFFLCLLNWMAGIFNG
jgi:hypothetical protein